MEKGKNNAKSTGTYKFNRRQFITAATVQAASASLATALAGDNPLTQDQVAAHKQQSQDIIKEQPYGPKDGMQLYTVGSGCPSPKAQWFGSTFILRVNKDYLMIDCGPATTYKMAKMGIRIGKIGHIFFTHHHFDHNADFPCFALTWWDQSTGKEPPLKIYGPPPTKIFVERLLGEKGAFSHDWKSRINHPVSQSIHKRRGGVLPRPVPALEVTDIGSGMVARSDTWISTAAHVHHVEPWFESVAYRFDTDHGSIVFAGDCGDCQALRQLAKSADTLVIGCVCIGSAKKYDNIICGTMEVAAIARSSGVRRVILSHVSPAFSRNGMIKRAIADVARNYDGIVLLPNELETVDLSK